LPEQDDVVLVEVKQVLKEVGLREISGLLFAAGTNSPVPPALYPLPLELLQCLILLLSVILSKAVLRLDKLRPRDLLVLQARDFVLKFHEFGVAFQGIFQRGRKFGGQPVLMKRLQTLEIIDTTVVCEYLQKSSRAINRGAVGHVLLPKGFRVGLSEVLRTLDVCVPLCHFKSALMTREPLVGQKSRRGEIRHWMRALTINQFVQLSPYAVDRRSAEITRTLHFGLVDRQTRVLRHRLL
jgi:hypothetical protein